MQEQTRAEESEQLLKRYTRSVKVDGGRRATRNRDILLPYHFRLDANQLRCSEDGTRRFITLTQEE